MRAFRESLAELFRYRELVLMLVVRDIRIRYKQAVLGMAWAVFMPLAMMAVFTMINRARILTIETGEVPYAVFAYCGLLLWSLFAQSMSAAVNCLVVNSDLVTKIYFPREVFPVASILAGLFDFLVASLVLGVLMLFHGIRPHASLLAAPVIIAIQVVFMVGLAAALAMGNLFYRDVRLIFQVVIMLWMFLTSVIYPIRVSSPGLRAVLGLNIMTPLIDAFRGAVLEGRWPDPLTMALCAAGALAACAAGLSWFHRAEFLFAERI